LIVSSPDPAFGSAIRLGLSETKYAAKFSRYESVDLLDQAPLTALGLTWTDTNFKKMCGCRVPLITTFLAAFQDSKQIYIVMEHCAGGDLLEQLLKEGRAMTEQRVALEVALPILTSLSHIHQLRIIHR